MRWFETQEQAALPSAAGRQLPAPCPAPAERGPLALRLTFSRRWWLRSQKLVGRTPVAPLPDRSLARLLCRQPYSPLGRPRTTMPGDAAGDHVPITALSAQEVGAEGHARSCMPRPAHRRVVCRRRRRPPPKPPCCRPPAQPPPPLPPARAKLAGVRENVEAACNELADKSMHIQRLMAVFSNSNRTVQALSESQQGARLEWTGPGETPRTPAPSSFGNEANGLRRGAVHPPRVTHPRGDRSSPQRFSGVCPRGATQSGKRPLKNAPPPRRPAPDDSPH
jgi:hypothetical protein